MRRMIMTAVATVSLAAPSAALAHNGERHHHHRGRHHHAHVLAFHAQAPAGSTTTGTSSPSSTPSSTSDSAGTIASFTGGVLTITLNDGSTVSGKVTERTEIECPAASTGTSAPAPGSSSFGEREHGDDGHFDNSNDGSNSGSDGQGGNCPGHEGDGAQNEHCTSAALVPGASVKQAFLSVSSDGAAWVKVKL
jgi:Ni/Co efflux regulator RcnB